MNKIPKKIATLALALTMAIPTFASATPALKPENNINMVMKEGDHEDREVYSYQQGEMFTAPWNGSLTFAGFSNGSDVRITIIVNGQSYVRHSNTNVVALAVPVTAGATVIVYTYTQTGSYCWAYPQ